MLTFDHKPSVIIFDVFGTLVKIGERRSPYRKLMRYLKQAGRTPQTDDAATIMSVDIHDFESLSALFGQHIPQHLLQELNQDLAYEINSMQLYQDTLPTLQHLQQAGFRVGLCSNLAAPYGSPVSAMLPPLDVYAWSYTVGAVKPDDRIYQYLLDQLACKAEDILFIGDTLVADVEGPITFGMSAKLIDRHRGQTLWKILDLE